MRLFQYQVKKGSERQDFFWNMAGNLCNSAHSILMLAVVSRFCGEEYAGIFSLTYSTAQLMYLVNCFQLSDVLVTDAHRLIGFRDTVVFRFGTNVLMILIAFLFCTVQGFDGLKLQTFALLIIYMILLSLTELCECHFHRNGYLNISGKSLAINLMLNSFTFAVVLFATKNLLAAIAAMCCVIVLWLIFFDFPYLKSMLKNHPIVKVSKSALISLTKLCTPLVFIQFIMDYINNAPKFAINAYLTNRDQSYFGYIMMPAACVNLLSFFALRPQLINLSQSLTLGDRKFFSKTVAKLVGWNIVASVCVLVGGYFLGIQLLSIFYGVDLTGMRPHLCIVLLGGCFYAFANLFDVITTTMRCHQWNLLIYIPAFFLAVVLPRYFVQNFGLMGAALAYMLIMLLITVGSGLVYLRFVKKKFA